MCVNTLYRSLINSSLILTTRTYLETCHNLCLFQFCLFYMGARFSRIAKRFLPKSKVRILMVGLDGSGKTTILYKLKLGEVVTTVPTIGFNLETVEYKGINFTVWDIGGQEK
ncbi:hypothetical protein CARUB_v100161551mg, partial [Capsella rubella]